MAKVNIKELYPFVIKDTIVDVPEELVDFIKEEKRKEKAYAERVRKNKAYFSLDKDDGIEAVINTDDITVIMYYEKELQDYLFKCIATLSIKQQKRIVAYYYYGYSLEEIAKIEGVHFTSVHESITNGLKKIKKILENTPKNPL